MKHVWDFILIFYFLLVRGAPFRNGVCLDFRCSVILPVLPRDFHSVVQRHLLCHLQESGCFITHYLFLVLCGDLFAAIVIVSAREAGFQYLC